MRIAAIIFVIGLSLIGYGLTLPAYTNHDIFTKELSRIENLADGSYENDRNKAEDQFYELKREMLTPRYRFIDYGITLIMTAFVLFLFTRKGKFKARLIGSRMGLVAFAIALSFLTVSAPIFGAILSEVRIEFPPWDDAYLHGLVLAPFFIVPFLAWSFLHIALFSKPNQYAKPLTYSLIYTSNWWLLFISAVTMIIVAFSAALGLYWIAMPGFLWVYFYLSLAISRQGINS